MNISSTTASAVAPTYARAMQAREMARQAKAEEKRRVAQNVAEAMNSARMDAPERAKRDAKAKLTDIVKRVQLLKKLFAGNPKEMARALAQVFKELRAAVKAYKNAGGEELGLAGDAAKGAVAHDAGAAKDEPSQTDDPSAAEDDAPAAGAVDAETASPAEDSDPAQPTAAQGAAVYDAVVGKMRKAIGEDGLDFVKTVRGLVNALSDILESARTQAKARKRDKDTDAAFDDADKEMRALRDDLDGMARDIRNAVPTAGLKLSMDA